MQKAISHYRKQANRLERNLRLTDLILTTLSNKGYEIPNLDFPMTAVLLHHTVQQHLATPHHLESYVFRKRTNPNARLCLVVTLNRPLSPSRTVRLIQECTAEQVTQLVILSETPMRELRPTINRAKKHFRVWWITTTDMLRATQPDSYIGRGNSYTRFVGTSHSV